MPPTLTRSNPVYPGYFADPAVFRASSGMYYAYGTGHGPESDGRQFPILRSSDLASWEYVGGALPPLAPENGVSFTAYWAPECVEKDGKFYLYYSAATGGLDETHRLRVAQADHPEGPFRDLGRIALPGEFADAFCIDAHPFRDPKSGRWFLFFATDFFTDRVGTGIAVVPLNDDMRSTDGQCRIVLRASADWHIYERNRHHYGRSWTAWHTIEGPFVWHHEGFYYCFYSGGNWQTHTYGVSYGVADNPLGPYTDDWSQHGPAVLRGIEGRVLGPGHNSIATAPDGKTDVIIYHAWDKDRTARRMFVDELIWEEETPTGPHRPRCQGPTPGAMG
ncbi:MAG TPA: glycoside hydrolase family 43 protein [Tepidisphaeraceae bacterium]|nr:glycoside hydrolase family 43 protein [Tepidisphaeraceae bacterium]